MESLTDILEKLEPQLEPRRPLVGPVLASIAARKRRTRLTRRILWLLAVCGLLALTVAVARSSSGQVAQLGWHQWAIVRQHWPLYLRAIGESVPWAAMLAFGAVVSMAATLSRLGRRALALRPATLAGALLAGSLGVSAGAYAAVTTTPTPGPAYVELERIVNSLGKQETIINGQTYEFPAGLTDAQIRAQAEMATLANLTNALSVQRGADGGQNSCACRVVSYTDTGIQFEWYKSGGDPISPNQLVIDGSTVQYDGLTPVPKLDLHPGDYVIVAPSTDGTHAAYIAKPTYSLADAEAAAQVNVGHAMRRTDGRCFNNTDDACPALPAVYDIGGSYLPPETDVPAGAIIREVYGRITKLNDQQVVVQTSSGQTWTFVISNWITSLNDAGVYAGPSQPVNHNLKVGVGDHLRIEFWQKSDALDARTVYGVDPAAPRTKAEAQAMIAAGTLNLNFRSQIRSLQLALTTPWQLGQPAQKF